MANTASQKPCLVETTQGFSVLYNNKYLYSKYSPARTINNVIENLTILPGTVILCCSPVLDYGIKELLNKVPENCILFACEFDNQLLNFEQESLKNIEKLIRLNVNELYDLPVILNKKSYSFQSGKKTELAGNFKRVIRIDFSAGTQFYAELYDKLFSYCTNAIKTFWTNRVTITHFGRRYSKNFFTNLNNTADTIPIENFFNKITKPIIVAGAGQSLNTLSKDIANTRDNYFILCADTALKPLLAQGITPDGVFVDEAQFVISKAFLGISTHNLHLFASLCSLPQLGTYFNKKNISYYTTLFTDADFLNSTLKLNFPAATKPFGSVGLTTVYFALKFRKDNSVPVFIYGLDFSYSAGITHAKQTIAHENRLLVNSRIIPLQNYESSFCCPALQFSDKSNNDFFTTPILKSYSDLFISCFFNEKNLYDSSKCGIDLHLPQSKPYSLNTEALSLVLTSSSFDSIKEYLLNERKELENLKNLLTGNTKLPEERILDEIKKIVQKREYLYFHFPDGFKFTYNQSFLNRIRAEIDYFLKYI